LGGVALMTAFARFVEAGTPQRIIAPLMTRVRTLVPTSADIETSDTPTGRR
jgi:hypothetical protein